MTDFGRSHCASSPSYHLLRPDSRQRCKRLGLVANLSGTVHGAETSGLRWWMPGEETNFRLAALRSDSCSGMRKVRAVGDSLPLFENGCPAGLGGQPFVESFLAFDYQHARGHAVVAVAAEL